MGGGGWEETFPSVPPSFSGSITPGDLWPSASCVMFASNSTGFTFGTRWRTTRVDLVSSSSFSRRGRPLVFGRTVTHLKASWATQQLYLSDAKKIIRI